MPDDTASPGPAVIVTTGAPTSTLPSSPSASESVAASVSAPASLSATPSSGMDCPASVDTSAVACNSSPPLWEVALTLATTVNVLSAGATTFNPPRSATDTTKEPSGCIVSGWPSAPNNIGVPLPVNVNVTSVNT